VLQTSINYDDWPCEVARVCLNEAFNIPELFVYNYRYGAKINLESTRGETPIHFALYFEAMGAAEILIRRGAQLMSNGEIASFLKGTVVHYAAYKGQTEMLDLLIDFGAEIYSSGQSHGAIGVSPLFFCCRGSSVELNQFQCFKKLIHLGCDVSARSSSTTPVASEALTNNTSAEQLGENRVKLLLRYGAALDSPEGGDTLWQKILQNPKPELVRLLIQAGIDLTIEMNDDGRKPLAHVARCYPPDCLRLINAFGGDMDEQDNKGFSALHLATTHGGVDNMSYLIACGADVNLRCNNYLGLQYATPLHVAALGGRADRMRVLVEAGCDINSVCCMSLNNDRDLRDNATVLHITTYMTFNSTLTKYLLECGCHPNIQNSAGKIVFKITRYLCLKLACVLG
jgi:ankyrin repeat protein